VWLDETDSTQLRAWAIHAEGDRSRPVVVAAETQTAGRGQWGRSWGSPPGGAWFSVLLPGVEADELLAVRAAETVRDVLIRLGGLEATRCVLKRPNDVLVDGRKVAGVLAEHRVTGGVSAVVIGVGINVAVDVDAVTSAVESTGEGMRLPACSLSDVCADGPSVRVVVEECATALYAASSSKRWSVG
jgi:BirA family biotin operon repressor/biotin-[acetyl-CoA-carboxylase] ligase